MFIRLQYPLNKLIASVEPRLRKTAEKVILRYFEGAAEKKLDEYLIKNYKTNLKLMCLKLLKDMQFNTDGNAALVITFKTKELEHIAHFITYGNSNYFGSKILLTALHAPIMM